jgi:hypothetical protein
VHYGPVMSSSWSSLSVGGTGRLDGGGVLRTGAGMEIGSPESRGQVSLLLHHRHGRPSRCM